MMADHVETVFERKAGRPFTPHEALLYEFYNTGAQAY